MSRALVSILMLDCENNEFTTHLHHANNCQKQVAILATEAFSSSKFLKETQQKSKTFRDIQRSLYTESRRFPSPANA